MGKGSERIAASSGGSETDGLGSYEAHDVGVRASEDCGSSAGKVGEGEATEESCVAWERAV